MSSIVAWPASNRTVLPASMRPVQLDGGVGDHGPQPVGVLEQLVERLVDSDGTPVVDLHQQVVLLVERALDLGAQDLLVEQVPHADADAVGLVGVRRADAPARGADAALAEEPLRHLVDGAVVRRDDVRAARHEQPGHVHAARDQRVELLEQDLDVDHHAVGDDRYDTRRQDPGRQEVQRILLVVDDDRVPRVVPTVELDHVIDAGAQEVRRLSLALIAPLGPDEHDAWHGSPPSRIAWVARVVRHRWRPRAAPESTSWWT